MLFISWHPPYTLKGVPILFYRVKINPFLNTTVENTTLYIPFELSQTEITIAITVEPVNRVGEGKATSILTNLATSFMEKTGTCRNKQTVIITHIYNYKKAYMHEYLNYSVADTKSPKQKKIMRTTYTTKSSFATLTSELLQAPVLSSTTGTIVM